MWTPPTPVTKTIGRPPGSAQKLAIESRLRAQMTGELPHEFLLRVARGELIKGQAWDPVRQCAVDVYESADLATRIDAAKAAAPYYAPKLQSVEVVSTLFGNATDDDLDRLITESAAAAGVSLGLAREGEAAEEDTGRKGRVKLQRA